MTGKQPVASKERIKSKIFFIRGQKVMLSMQNCMKSSHGRWFKPSNVTSNVSRKAFYVELARKLTALEKKYDIQFKAICELMAPLQPKKKRSIGFAPWKEK